MKKGHSFSMCAVGLSLLVSTCFVAAAEPLPSFTVKLIGFNDFHGNLQSPGTFGQNTLVPAASRPAVGGADFMAAYVARLKA
jgi:5'-nucleotidase